MIMTKYAEIGADPTRNRQNKLHARSVYISSFRPLFGIFLGRFLIPFRYLLFFTYHFHFNFSYFLWYALSFFGCRHEVSSLK